MGGRSRQWPLGAAEGSHSLLWMEQKNLMAAHCCTASKENCSHKLIIGRWDQPQRNDEKVQASWWLLSGNGVNLPDVHPVVGRVHSFWDTGIWAADSSKSAQCLARGLFPVLPKRCFLKHTLYSGIVPYVPTGAHWVSAEDGRKQMALERFHSNNVWDAICITQVCGTD